VLVISIGNDWTKYTPEVGFPYIQHVYRLFTAEENAENLHLEHEMHDYGYSKRLGAYKFLAKHLGLDLEAITKPHGVIDESGIVIEPQETLQVFGPQQSMPDHAVSSPEEVERLLKATQDHP